MWPPPTSSHRLVIKEGRTRKPSEHAERQRLIEETKKWEKDQEKLRKERAKIEREAAKSKCKKETLEKATAAALRKQQQKAAKLVQAETSARAAAARALNPRPVASATPLLTNSSGSGAVSYLGDSATEVAGKNQRKRKSQKASRKAQLLDTVGAVEVSGEPMASDQQKQENSNDTMNDIENKCKKAGPAEILANIVTARAPGKPRAKKRQKQSRVCLAHRCLVRLTCIQN